MANSELYHGDYPLVNVYSLRTGKWPSQNRWFAHENSMVIFHSYVNVYQRVIEQCSTTCREPLDTGWLRATNFPIMECDNHQYIG